MQDMGLLDEDDEDDAGGHGGAGGRKKGRGRGAKLGAEAGLGLDTAAPDVQGSLGAKLDDLGRSLLSELNTIAHKSAVGRGGGGGGAGDMDERGSTRSSQVPTGTLGARSVAGRGGGAGASGATSRLGVAGRK